MRDAKDHMDLFGAASLIGFSALLALNQVVIKLSASGLQPVLLAGLRSLGVVICLGGFLWWRGRSVRLEPHQRRPAFWLGLLFAIEFVFLFTALDLTTVVRASILFYSMPVWLALGAHVLLPGQRLTRLKSLGLVVAFIGVAWAILSGASNDIDGQGNLTGDILALLAAVCWAAIGLCTRATSLREVTPRVQIFYQVLISAPLLILGSLAFGPLLREVTVITYAGLAFQIALVSFGFPFWIWLLSLYPPSGVASFSFLGPVFGVLLGWGLLGEAISPQIIAALGLVAVGLVLINRPAKPQVPQKV